MHLFDEKRRIQCMRSTEHTLDRDSLYLRGRQTKREILIEFKRRPRDRKTARLVQKCIISLMQWRVKIYGEWRPNNASALNGKTAENY